MSGDSFPALDSTDIQDISPTVIDTPVGDPPSLPAQVTDQDDRLDRVIYGLLDANGPLLQRRLTEATNKSKSSVHKSLSRLKQSGQVMSRPWVRDTRQQLVIPTETEAERGRSDD